MIHHWYINLSTSQKQIQRGNTRSFIDKSPNLKPLDRVEMNVLYHHRRKLLGGKCRKGFCRSSSVSLQFFKETLSDTTSHDIIFVW